jgi:arylsulfatase A-like enzyme/cytochrome c-type biogenesis protein CcmH/NrfG
VVAGIVACSSGSRPAPPPSAASNLVVITIDTLRADRVGAYGYAAARTPAIDALARRGTKFERAYAPAPITLTSHASLFTGRYPPGHHARHNGMPLDPQAPLLADMLSKNGLSTGAFVAAFPLDARFGLARGFGTYSDRMPRAPDGRPANERPARIVIDEAVEWLDRHRGGRFFLWVHLFEPHSPYGGPGDPERSRLPAQARYDDEVAEADRQAGRLVDALGAESASTIVVLASDHGEAFGEHGEIGHSLFIYDTTLRVPLVLAGPGIPEGRTVADPVALIDVAPTMLRLLGIAGTGFDADGVDLAPALGGAALPNRELYAESFAPLFDFGWSGLRSLRAERWKFIAAPRPELYDLSSDANETANVVEREPALARTLASRVEKYAGAEPVVASAPPDPEAASRLRALGYASGHPRGTPSARPDPKDRRELALRLAQVASGEVAGRDLENALTAILKDDPGNPQAHLRLGYVRLESNEVTAAKRHFRTAIDARLPGADGYLGLAECEARSGRRDAAARALRDAERAEPNNPVVAANLGIVLAEAGRHADGIAALERAVAIDPEFHQARFNLARVYARAGRRADAAAAARELLRRLPGDAPQRAEVERLLAAVQ